MHQKHENLFISQDYSPFNLEMEFMFLKIDVKADAKTLAEFKFNYFTKNVIYH